MSARPENTVEEIADLVDARIISIRIAEDGGPDGGDVVRLHVRYREGFSVNGSNEGVYELWQDEEGNGPGYISYIGAPS